MDDNFYKTWSGDWHARVMERIASLGFASATEFADRHPNASLFELVAMLGREDIAAHQIELILREETGGDAARFAHFARSLLVRMLLEQMPNGWNEQKIATVYGMWSGDVGEEYYGHVDRVFDLLESEAPTGWRPSGPTDPLIEKAFALWHAPPTS